MKKTVSLIIIALFFISTAINAQKNSFFVAAGPTTGTSFNNHFSVPWGASLKVRYGVSKAGSITGDVSYLGLLPNNPMTTFNTSIVSVKGGFLTYIKNTHLFVQADLGFFYTKYKSVVHTVSGLYFITGLGAGYSFLISKKSSIDISTNINYVSQANTISPAWLLINLAYRFKLKSNKSK